jgi:hypothetical protein
MNGSRPVTNSLRHGPQTLLMTGSFALRIQKPKFQSSYPGLPRVVFFNPMGCVPKLRYRIRLP